MTSAAFNPYKNGQVGGLDQKHTSDNLLSKLNLRKSMPEAKESDAPVAAQTTDAPVAPVAPAEPVAAVSTPAEPKKAETPRMITWYGMRIQDTATERRVAECAHEKKQAEEKH